MGWHKIEDAQRPIKLEIGERSESTSGVLGGRVAQDGVLTSQNDIRNRLITFGVIQPVLSVHLYVSIYITFSIYFRRGNSIVVKVTDWEIAWL